MDSTMWAAVITIVGMFVLAIIGWGWGLHEKVALLREQLGKLREDHLKFQLEAAGKYASIPYLQDVEERIVTSIDKLSNVVDELRKNLVTIAQSNQRNPNQRN